MNFKTLSVVFYFSFLVCLAQEKDDFGKLTSAEIEFSTFEKDKEANAIVLYERGNYYFEVVNNRIQLVKNYHGKIKILNIRGFDYGNISIPFYKSENSSEKVKNIKAITHNNGSKTHLSINKIFTNNLSERWSEKRFAFPKLAEGSILEYQYTILSPFLFNLDGWEFQTDIPKLYSEFNAKIPSNYRYNRNLSGALRLSTNDASIKKECFYIKGYPNPADCEVLKYIMRDIPAFKEDEDYMLASSNYISKLDFELSEHIKLDGSKKKYTKSWKDVDKEFRFDKDIGRQLTKKKFFEKNVPDGLLSEGDNLTRAKNIYKFIQNHFTWNKRNSTYGKARVKDAFDEKKGNAWEINMSLINLLNAGGIKANLMLSSTRDNGLPKKKHPIMSGFNYVLAKVDIDGKNYLLDATNKYMPFGMLPFRTLNHYGRVMDFKNESTWFDIKPETNNKYQIRGQITFDVEEQKAQGIMDMLNFGYDAVNSRLELDTNSEDIYLENWEENFRGDFKINTYKLIPERSDDSKTAERFEFELENVLNGDMVYFNPFLIQFFDKNPFTLEERNYPVDFGYPRHYKYDITIKIPEGYKVHELPETQAVRLGEDAAFFKFQRKELSGSVQILFDLKLSDSYFEADDYGALKKLFKHVTDVQNNALLVLKKE